MNMEQAASRAKQFLSNVAGVPTLWLRLRSAKKEGNIWSVSFTYKDMLGQTNNYVVKLTQDGEILEYSEN